MRCGPYQPELGGALSAEHSPQASACHIDGLKDTVLVAYTMFRDAEAVLRAGGGLCVLAEDLDE